ncbi:cation diffusion facilitator family transporter [Sideroxydans lithotrophicus]|uniref:Cation diffusion facilitator family transporter n=1 Tax=Sideroxydans lithotrophicus (strain ES-1) TaxID=580332 RepID=D5CQC6_SIDLE|nr:cation diffusion facilitator family transporter [Sideroxydans lithotrophicus]ADE13147.1 cation diffusion facilitator family transporter [Sideroxydans lithotrophicus ES-1]
MKNHTHGHTHDKSAAFEPAHPVRFAAARKSTWVSIFINLGLTIIQVLAGFFGKSQSLMADGLHSLADLLSDVLVLFANRHGNKHADANHPYGHARIETAASLILGTSLAALGIGLLIAAGMRLQHPEQVQAVHPLTLWVAIIALAAKEGMFRYMLAVAQRVRSQMLVANAWHARSDAASSLVVIIGIVGNLLGYTFLDLVAAAVVGVMIAYMGIQFARDALSELIDTGLDEETVRAIRNTLKAVPGVIGLHELRTRKMADNALVDAHIIVEPKISVSEGHYIAEAARIAVLKGHQVMDVMVHIDSEDDAKARPNVHLPQRHLLLAHLGSRLGAPLPPSARVVLHYLGGKVEAELLFDSQIDLEALRDKCRTITASDPYFSSIQLYQGCAPK